MLINGIRRVFPNLTLGAVNYWVKDTINSLWRGRLDAAFGGGDKPSYRISFNDLDQLTVGAQLVPRRGLRHIPVPGLGPIGDELSRLRADHGWGRASMRSIRALAVLSPIETG